MGLRSKYYACMEGAVYDITEWAFCQVFLCSSINCYGNSVPNYVVVGWPFETLAMQLASGPISHSAWARPIWRSKSTIKRPERFRPFVVAISFIYEIKTPPLHDSTTTHRDIPAFCSSKSFNAFSPPPNQELCIESNSRVRTKLNLSAFS